MENLWQDLRYAFRILGKHPAFGISTVLVLALAIGANTALFTVVNSVLLRPLPYQEPERLVELYEVFPDLSWEHNFVSPLNYLDWKEQNNVFEDMAAFAGPGWGNRLSYVLTGEGEAERLFGDRVMPSFFSILGVSPAMGRIFDPGELWAGTDTTVILSDGLWRRRFAADPDVLGRTILLNGRSFEVVGVMPPGFSYGSNQFDLWVPFGWDQENFKKLRAPRFLRVLAKLKPGVTVGQAQAEMELVAARLAEEYPKTNKDMGVAVIPIRDLVISGVSPTLALMFVAAGFLLLTACSNIANLLLIRSSIREKEIATRLAIGASRPRLLRQLVTESLGLALLGGLLGLLAAVGAVRLLVQIAPAEFPRIQEIAVDYPVIAFTLGCVILSGLLFGLAPAWMASRPDLSLALASGGKGAGGSRRPVNSLLVLFQIVVSVVLLIGAGLMLKSVVRLGGVETGFEARTVLTAGVTLPSGKYKETDQKVSFYRQLMERIDGLPGVEAVGGISMLPMRGIFWTGDVTIEGRGADEFEMEIRRKEILPGYFQAMGVPIVQGRHFDYRDGDPQGAIIINESFAGRCFPGMDPVGKRLKIGRPDKEAPWLTIVGVVRDERQDSLRKESEAEIYEPYRQRPHNDMTLVIRTRSEPGATAEPVRNEIQAMDPDVPLYEVHTLEEVLAESIAQERYTLLLLSAFAALVLLIASVGIYGIVSQSAVQRTHEIGIRLALGGRIKDVIGIVFRKMAWLVSAGVVIGLAAALGLTRWLSSLLFEVSPSDPWVFVLVAIILGLVALSAGYIPIRKVMRIDPVEVLRYE